MARKGKKKKEKKKKNCENLCGKSLNIILCHFVSGEKERKITFFSSPSYFFNVILFIQ